MIVEASGLKRTRRDYLRWNDECNSIVEYKKATWNLNQPTLHVLSKLYSNFPLLGSGSVSSEWPLFRFSQSFFLNTFMYYQRSRSIPYLLWIRRLLVRANLATIHFSFLIWNLYSRMLVPRRRSPKQTGVKLFVAKVFEISSPCSGDVMFVTLSYFMH